ncbi:hypothetical protein BDW75DRAFT_232988 [Aspergillus navahoensis]
MAGPPRMFVHGDYTLEAAIVILDEKHPVLPEFGPHDLNLYILVSAATVAKDMIRSFQAVRFGMMVGIRGNSEEAGNQEECEDDMKDIQDIQLGDFVIYLHSKSSGAVVPILSTVTHLKAEHELRGHRISEALSNMMLSYPALTTKFQYPGSKKYCLFKSDIVLIAQTENVICFKTEAAGTLFMPIPMRQVWPGPQPEGDGSQVCIKQRCLGISSPQERTQRGRGCVSAAGK